MAGGGSWRRADLRNSLHCAFAAQLDTSHAINADMPSSRHRSLYQAAFTPIGWLYQCLPRGRGCSRSPTLDCVGKDARWIACGGLRSPSSKQVSLVSCGPALHGDGMLISRSAQFHRPCPKFKQKASRSPMFVASAVGDTGQTSASVGSHRPAVGAVAAALICEEHGAGP